MAGRWPVHSCTRAWALTDCALGLRAPPHTSRPLKVELMGQTAPAPAAAPDCSPPAHTRARLTRPDSSRSGSSAVGDGHTPSAHSAGACQCTLPVDLSVIQTGASLLKKRELAQGAPLSPLQQLPQPPVCQYRPNAVPFFVVGSGPKWGMWATGRGELHQPDTHTFHCLTLSVYIYTHNS